MGYNETIRERGINNTRGLTDSLILRLDGGRYYFLEVSYFLVLIYNPNVSVVRKRPVEPAPRERVM